MARNFKVKIRIVVLGSIFAFIFSFFSFSRSFCDEAPLKRLNDFARRVQQAQERAVGFPVNQNTDLKEFYEWYRNSNLYESVMNNVGDPYMPGLIMNTHEFEVEVVDFFAPLYGFSKEEAWGIVTMSGTDGNNHGIYYGVKQLLSQTKMLPVCYVSEEAHYSIKKLADLQNLELRLIKCDGSGKIIISEFEKALDPAKPALIVIAMGTTFKGAIDDQAAIDAVIHRKKPIAVYRHVDAALFGGYLPFTEYRDLVNRKVVHFDSIAVSAHKFFGFDEPAGIFITTKKTLGQINPFKVTYLNQAVPTITCSRSAISPLKFWWKINRTGLKGFREQATNILANAQYLEDKLKSIGWPVWKNNYSNTVYFRRPSEAIMKKYSLAPEFDSRLGGDLAHIVVMQHVSGGIIDQIVNDIKAEMHKEA
ncbi:MAG: aminotransferase class V-fold PLP-dependent enzyme [Candidatus Omnitrophota bacterium]